MSFKQKHTFSERYQQSFTIIQKYPDKVPIICQKNEKSTHTPNIDKIKYLVSFDLTLGQFMYIIRKRLNIRQDQAIFLFINGCIYPSSYLISELYDLYKDADGFLYCIYSYENVFG
jgi:GABA(A) receptor-associated protein